MAVIVMMAWLTLICIVFAFDFQQLVCYCTITRRDESCVWRMEWSLSEFNLSNDLEHLRRARVLC